MSTASLTNSWLDMLSVRSSGMAATGGSTSPSKTSLLFNFQNMKDTGTIQQFSVLSKPHRSWHTAYPCPFRLGQAGLCLSPQTHSIYYDNGCTQSRNWSKCNDVAPCRTSSSQTRCIPLHLSSTHYPFSFFVSRTHAHDTFVFQRMFRKCPRTMYIIHDNCASVKHNFHICSHKRIFSHLSFIFRKFPLQQIPNVW